jgi:hypothetical protein
MPSTTASTDPTVHFNYGVAELSGVSGRTLHELAVRDDRAADPGPDEDAEEIVHTATRPETVFTDGRDVDIVSQSCRHLVAILDLVGDREIDHRATQVGGADK